MTARPRPHAAGEAWRTDTPHLLPATGRLRDTHVGLLLERDAQEDALAVRWNLFDGLPTQSHYHDLRRTAECVGRRPSLRGRAVRRLRAMVAERRVFADSLVGVLLDEREHDQTWQVAVANEDVLADSRWQQLIEVRHLDCPADVVEALQNVIEQRLAASNDRYRYYRAITMIRQLRAVYEAAGDTGGFVTYVRELRDRHQRKTSFVSKLDQSGV